MSGLGGVFVAWLIWLTVTVFGNKQDIAINTANDLNVTKEFTAINKKMDDMKTEFTNGFNKLESKLDLYVKNENDFIKNLITQNKG